MYTHVRKFSMNVNYESPALRRRSKVCRSLMQGIRSTKSTEESTDIFIYLLPTISMLKGSDRSLVGFKLKQDRTWTIE